MENKLSDPRNATVGSQLDQPQSAVEGAMQNLERETAMIMDVVSVLEQRLSPLLAPTPSADASTGAESPSRSPLTEGIDASAGKVRYTRNKLEQLLNSLEV